MLDIILLIVLLLSCIIGAKRGFIVQIIHLGSFLIALIVAYIYYKPLAQKFVLWVPYPGFTEDATMTLVLDTLDASYVLSRYCFCTYFLYREINFTNYRFNV